MHTLQVRKYGEYFVYAAPRLKPCIKLYDKVFSYCQVKYIQTEQQLFLVLHALEKLQMCFGCVSKNKMLQSFCELELKGRKTKLTGKIVDDTIRSTDCTLIYDTYPHKFRCSECTRFQCAFMKRVKRHVPIKDEMHKFKVYSITTMVIERGQLSFMLMH